MLKFPYALHWMFKESEVGTPIEPAAIIEFLMKNSLFIFFISRDLFYVNIRTEI